MSNTTTLYQKSRKGAVKQWTLSVKGNQITTTWGQKNGKMQTTVDDVKSKGRIGTKAFKTPEEQALLEYERTITAMKERGYVENEKDLVDIQDMSEFSFQDMPVGFCPPKPIKKEPKLDAIEALITSGNALLQKKYDGGRILIRIDSNGEVALFTRTLEPCSEHFKQIRLGFQELATRHKLYDCLFDGELILGEGEKIEHFDLVNGLMPNTKAETAQAKIAELEAYRYSYNNTQGVQLFLRCVLFDVIFFCGSFTLSEEYTQRLLILRKLGIKDDGGCIGNYNYHNVTRLVLPKTFKVANINDYNELYKQLGTATHPFEGFILRDVSTGSEATLNGKEVRPHGCWKVKKIQEDDFVATGYELGTGKNKDVVGKLNIIQYDKKGNTVDCGNVGTFEGDEEQRAEALKWTYPVVVRVHYDRRQADGKLRFPRFIAKRDDKKPTECVFTK